jgi:hypothetical protein
MWWPIENTLVRAFSQLSCEEQGQLLPWLKAAWDYMWGLPLDPCSWKKTKLIGQLERLLNCWILSSYMGELRQDKQLWSTNLRSSPDGLWDDTCNIPPNPKWPSSQVPARLIAHIGDAEVHFKYHSVRVGVPLAVELELCVAGCLRKCNGLLACRLACPL